MKIIIGTEGEQPFKIKGGGVSRRHAEVEILGEGDNARWTLRDLDSTNGTFVRDDNGEMIPVGKKAISPMTFISLGPDNSKGCSFYARQLLHPGGFTEEYEFINEKEDEYEEKLEAIDKKARLIKWVIFAINIVIVVFSIAIENQMSLWILRSGTILSTFFAAIYDANGSKKRLKKRYEQFHHCPNPECSHKLNTAEIRNMRCQKCKK